MDSLSLKSTGVFSFTCEIIVDRVDGRWVKHHHHLTWLKQSYNSSGADWLLEWIHDLTDQIPGTKNMTIGDRWHFRISGYLEASKDYWGEYDDHFIVTKSRCFKKYSVDRRDRY